MVSVMFQINNQETNEQIKKFASSIEVVSVIGAQRLTLLKVTIFHTSREMA